MAAGGAEFGRPKQYDASWRRIQIRQARQRDPRAKLTGDNIHRAVGGAALDERDQPRERSAIARYRVIDPGESSASGDRISGRVRRMGGPAKENAQPGAVIIMGKSQAIGPTSDPVGAIREAGAVFGSVRTIRETGRIVPVAADKEDNRRTLVEAVELRNKAGFQRLFTGCRFHPVGRRRDSKVRHAKARNHYSAWATQG